MGDKKDIRMQVMFKMASVINEQLAQIGVHTKAKDRPLQKGLLACLH